MPATPTSRGAARSASDSTALERLERLQYAEQAVAVLRETAQMLRPVRGRRKAILYVGEGIDYELGDRTLDLMQSVNTFLSDVSRTGTVMYTLSPTGMRAPELGLEGNEGGLADGQFTRALDDVASRAYNTLRTWAVEGGGVSVVDTNNFEQGLAAIVADSSRYYLLGYESPVESDGRFHRIEVRTTRPDLTVRRSRRGYVASPGRARTAALTASAPGAGGSGAALDEALASPIPAVGVRLRVFAAPFRGTGPRHEALIGMHIDGRDLGLTPSQGAASAAALVEIVVLDEAGRVAASTRNSLEVAVPADRVEAMQTRGFRYLDRVDLAPGRYRVRAGAMVGGDRIGTVQCALDVPDFAAPRPAMSGLLLSSLRPGPGHSTGAFYSEHLRGPATAQREFLPEDELTAFAELYPNGTAGPFTALLRVLTDQDEVVLEWEQDLASPGVEHGPVPVRTTLPLEALAPGRYRLHVDVRPSQDAGPAVARDLTFVVARRADRQ